MNKKYILIVVAILLALMFMMALVSGGLFYLYYNGYFTQYFSQATTPSDPANISYTVGGQVFDLKDGKAEVVYSADSSTTNKVAIFGEPVYGDLDADGDNDAALLLTNDAGGTGTFYYAVLAMNDGGVYKSTNSILLGDRIAPQTVEIKNSQAIFNYADRNPGEPMTTPPSAGKSLYVNYDKSTNQISEASSTVN